MVNPIMNLINGIRYDVGVGSTSLLYSRSTELLLIFPTKKLFAWTTLCPPEPLLPLLPPAEFVTSINCHYYFCTNFKPGH